MTDGEAMQRTHPGTGSYYTHCLEGLRLPVEENSHGLTVQYQYLMVKRDVFFNVITCSSRLLRPQCSWLSGGPHQSSKTHLKPSSAHSSCKWEALTQVQTKTKSSKTSFLSNITGLWVMCLDSPRLEFFQTGLETEATVNISADWLEISEPTCKHMATVRELAC